MNSYKLVVLGTLAATMAVPTLSFADDDKKHHGERHGKRFEKIDLNKDGKLSLEETVQGASARFDKTDKNKDGEISLEEMADRIQRRRDERRARRMMERMDFNNDGKVTKDEIENRAKKRFALMDRNDDGLLEKSEMRRGKHMRKRHGEGGKRKHRRKHSMDDDL